MNVLKVCVFAKATKFDEISTLLLTNKFVFLRFPPNFEFSVSLSGAPETLSIFKSGQGLAKFAFVRNEQKRQNKFVSI